MTNNINKKKYRKRRSRQAFPWLFAALGGLLLVTAVFLFANKSGGGGSGTPAITLDKPAIDYGYVKFGESRQFKIKVTNTGSGMLRFNEKPYVEVLEGC